MTTLKDQIITSITNSKDEIHNRFHVDYLAIFGSVAKETASPNSDIDILVKYKEIPGFFEFINLKTFLEDITKRQVDLVTEGALKKQLKAKIIKEAIRVT